MSEPLICDRCGHDWYDHNHEGHGLIVRSNEEDCCTVRLCDCPIFIFEESVGESE